MISSIIYIITIVILVYVSIVAVKATSRGIKAKKNLNKNRDIGKDKKRNEKD